MVWCGKRECLTFTADNTWKIMVTLGIAIAREFSIFKLGTKTESNLDIDNCN